VRAVAGALDRRDERVDGRRRRVEPHLRGLGREVHGGVRRRQTVQHLLDARRAGRAGHALEREVDLVGASGRGGGIGAAGARRGR
jgi:hypothetical protein